MSLDRVKAVLYMDPGQSVKTDMPFPIIANQVSRVRRIVYLFSPFVYNMDTTRPILTALNYNRDEPGDIGVGSWATFPLFWAQGGFAWQVPSSIGIVASPLRQELDYSEGYDIPAPQLFMARSSMNVPVHVSCEAWYERVKVSQGEYEQLMTSRAPTQKQLHQ